MSTNKDRLPPDSELRLLLRGADLAAAKQELENAQNGDECLDKVAFFLHCELNELPKDIPTNTEPSWVHELLFAIKAHREFNGV
jgi:hypothetical protein